MTKNWIALNIVLLMVAGSLAWQLHLGIDRFNAQNDPAKIVPVRDLKQSSAQEGELAPMAQPPRTSAADFSAIPEKNAFSPLRAREAKTDVVAIPETPPLTQKPILVGVTITGSQRMASVIDPTLQSSGGRRSQIKRLGDMYQGYTITDITADQMVLEAGTRKEIIPLHMGTKRTAQTGKTPILATRVISIGAGAASGGTAVQATAVSAGGTARSSAGSTAQAATPASSGRGTRASTPQQGSSSTASDQAPQSGSRTASSRTQAATPALQSQPSSGTSGSGSQGRRVIRTPFGDVTAPDTP
jgi:hypothetical protein